MTKPNQLYSIVKRINELPAFKQQCLSLAFNTKVKYAGTTGLAIERWDLDGATVHCKNRLRVQNHIGSVHATAMATLAESATGMVFGLHVPDSHLPLLKSMKIDYTALAKGNLTAVATITEEQKKEITTAEKGSTNVQVKVTDEEGKEPIQCAMEWAWTPKRKKPKN